MSSTRAGSKWTAPPPTTSGAPVKKPPVPSLPTTATAAAAVSSSVGAPPQPPSAVVQSTPFLTAEQKRILALSSTKLKPFTTLDTRTVPEKDMGSERFDDRDTVKDMAWVQGAPNGHGPFVYCALTRNQIVAFEPQKAIAPPASSSSSSRGGGGRGGSRSNNAPPPPPPPRSRSFLVPFAPANNDAAVSQNFVSSRYLGHAQSLNSTALASLQKGSEAATEASTTTTAPAASQLTRDRYQRGGGGGGARGDDYRSSRRGGGDDRGGRDQNEDTRSVASGATATAGRSTQPPKPTHFHLVTSIHDGTLVAHVTATTESSGVILCNSSSNGESGGGPRSTCKLVNLAVEPPVPVATAKQPAAAAAPSATTTQVKGRGATMSTGGFGKDVNKSLPASAKSASVALPAADKWSIQLLSVAYLGSQIAVALTTSKSGSRASAVAIFDVSIEGAQTPDGKGFTDVPKAVVKCTHLQRYSESNRTPHFCSIAFVAPSVVAVGWVGGRVQLLQVSSETPFAPLPVPSPSSGAKSSQGTDPNATQTQTQQETTPSSPSSPTPPTLPDTPAAATKSAGSIYASVNTFSVLAQGRLVAQSALSYQMVSLLPSSSSSTSPIARLPWKGGKIDEDDEDENDDDFLSPILVLWSTEGDGGGYLQSYQVNLNATIQGGQGDEDDDNEPQLKKRRTESTAQNEEDGSNDAAAATEVDAATTTAASFFSPFSIVVGGDCKTPRAENAAPRYSKLTPGSRHFTPLAMYRETQVTSQCPVEQLVAPSHNTNSDDFDTPVVALATGAFIKYFNAVTLQPLVLNPHLLSSSSTSSASAYQQKVDQIRISSSSGTNDPRDRDRGGYRDREQVVPPRSVRVALRTTAGIGGGGVAVASETRVKCYTGKA